MMYPLNRWPLLLEFPDWLDFSLDFSAPSNSRRDRIALPPAYNKPISCSHIWWLALHYCRLVPLFMIGRRTSNHHSCDFLNEPCEKWFNLKRNDFEQKRNIFVEVEALMRQISRQASINAQRNSLIPNRTVKQATLLWKECSTKRHKLVSARGVSAKMTTNGIRTQTIEQKRNWSWLFPVKLF